MKRTLLTIGLVALPLISAARGASAIQFSQATFSASEDEEAAVITVVRASPTNTTAAVDLVVTGGTARPGQDYDLDSATVTFLPGDTQQSLRFRLHDNPVVNGARTVELSLRNPTGDAVLGNRTTATMTILDNERPTLIDTSFNPELLNHDIRALALQPDGKLLLGAFGQPGQPLLFRLNSDGRMDGDFDPVPSGRIGYGINTLLLQVDGKIVAGAYSVATNGPAFEKLARFNPDGSLDTSFQPRLKTRFTGGSGVGTLLLLSDGRILVAGDFISVNGVDRERVALLKANGDVDTQFDPSLFLNRDTDGAAIPGGISGMAVQVGNKLLVSGSFVSVAGMGHTNLVRLNSDGSVDTGYQPELPPNAGLARVLEQADGKVIVAGWSTNLPPSGAPFMMRLFPTGEADPSFVPAREVASVWGIADMHFQSDGKLLVSGWFNDPNVYRPRILRLTPEGALDRNLTEVFDITEVATSFPILADPQGRLIGTMGLPAPDGSYSFFGFKRLVSDYHVPSIGFTETNLTATEINGPFRISLTRSGDTTQLVSIHFTSQDGTARDGVNYVGRSGIAVFGTQQVTQSVNLSIKDDGVVTGDLTVHLSLDRPSAGVVPNPQAEAVLTIQDRELPFPLGPNTRAISFSSPEYHVGEDQDAVTATVLRSGDVTGVATVQWQTVNASAEAGNDFGAANGTLRFARLEVEKAISVPVFHHWLAEPDKTFQLTLSHASDGTLLGAGPNTATVVIHDSDRPGSIDFNFRPPVVPQPPWRGGGVFALARQADGKLVVSMRENVINPMTGLGTSVVRLNSDGTLDGDFRLTVPFRPDPFALSDPDEQSVGALATLPDGRIMLGAAGSWSLSVNGSPVDSLTRLNPDGSIDDTFKAWQETDGAVGSIALQPDGKLVLGGTFTEINGVVRKGIVRVDSSGDVDALFDPGTGVNLPQPTWPLSPRAVHFVQVQPDGKILLAGGFTSVQGTARNRIARLDSDGLLDITFDPGKGANDLITKAALRPDGKILVVGSFTSFNGVRRQGMARLNRDGSLDATFDPQVRSEQPVTDVALQADGRVVLAGGVFATTNGVTRAGVVRLNPDGSLDEAFDPGSGPATGEGPASVSTVLLLPDGDIVAGGTFTSFDGTSCPGLVRLHGDFPPRLEVAAGLSDSAARVRLSSLSGRTCVLEVSEDLTHWTELETRRAVDFTVEFKDPASGTSSHRFYRARQLSQ